MDLTKLDSGGGESVDWIDLAKDKDKWWTVVNTVMNI